MTTLPAPPRPWWLCPGPLVALILHAVIFLGLFQMRLPEGAWGRMAEQLPPNPTLSQWIDRMSADHGRLGFVRWFFDTHREIGLYYRYASVTLHGIDPRHPADDPRQGHFAPYREVKIEYQPGALLVLLPPGIVARDYDSYITAFVAWCGLLYGASLWLGLRLLADGRPLTPAQAGRALWGSVFFLFCFGGVAAARFDHIVPLLCLGSIALFRRAERTGSSGWFAACGALTACGALVKIVPGVVLPAALLCLCAAGPQPRWRPALALLTGFGVTLLVLNGLFYAWWGDGYVRSYTYHMERGIQLETLYAGIILAARGFGLPYALVENYGAAHLATPLTPFLKSFSTLLFFAASAAVAGRFWRRCSVTARLVPAHALLVLTLAFLLAFILTNKVLSPQYLLWVGPLLAALYGLRPDFFPGLLILLVVSVLSQLIFPFLYEQLLEFKFPLVVLLNVRNGLLLVLFGWLLWRLPRLLAEPADPA